MNSDLYCDILVNKLKPGIRNKRRGKLSKGVLFLHDNARPHTSSKTVSTIIKLGFEVLEHPAYSADLVSSDYFLFGLLKKELKGRRFDSDEDVQKVAFKENSLSQSRTFEWFARFKAGRTSVKNDLHILSIRNPENALKIKSSVKENPRINIRDLSEDLDISFGTCQTIIKNDPHLKRSTAKFVPHILTNEHRKETCKNMVEMFNSDPHWLKNVITGDETWVYGYDPETKRQSRQWLEPEEPRFKKARMIKSKLKCLLITFFDVKGLVHYEFVPEAAIIVALRAGRSPKEIVDFLKLPKTTIYRVKKQFDEADSNKEGIATRKKHSRRSDRVRGEEFVKNVKEKIDGNPGKSMRAIAKEMDVGSMTIVRTIHEDLGLKSYALRKGQLLTENMKNNRKGKAAALLNNLKHDSFGMLRFFSDEKNFDVDQKVNPRNDRWICKDPSKIPVVMHTKFPASVMVLGVISSEGDVMPPHFFEKGLRMNADTYINVLETVVKPWMDMVAAGRKYVFQQDSAPAHKAKKTQSWLTLNVPSHWGPDIWPPNSPDCNPLDYYVWGVVERDVNKAPHTTIQSVKKAVHTVMTQMDKVIVAKACASFRTRLETVVANNGNYIE
ncbi:hypothetical protein LAZ67_2006419 [Cordylochernes scorpioides]|uniref:Transposase n=1 Tax=Cordylochernes scorpioides TaxID=51811 RepID=A0ABY6K674_9ARAC|nr:hypothetical protein LAZ67_2006419 [Cordylochernes scorpioides]